MFAGRRVRYSFTYIVLLTVSRVFSFSRNPDLTELYDSEGRTIVLVSEKTFTLSYYYLNHSQKGIMTEVV